MDFFLDNLLNNKMNIEESIVSVLRARGFLIDELEGRYYISDNATIEDVEFLESGLNSYSLGTIKNDKEYVWSTRRCWEAGVITGINRYETLRPRKVELEIRRDATLENAICFFNSVGRNRATAGPEGHSWDQFVLEALGTKPNVSLLEAYVALYVKAASSCGVYTCYSCDGNHDDGGKIYVHADYPSDIWHKFLWEYIVCREYGNIPFIGKGIEFSGEESQREVYQLVNMIATYLYINRRRIRIIKEMTVQSITKKVRHSLSDEEIEKLYIEECERVLSKEYV